MARRCNSPHIGQICTIITCGDKKVQEIIGTLLYCARTVDSTILVILGKLVSQQANPMRNTEKSIIHLPDYVVTHIDATILYHTSRMTLHIHSNASYLLKAKSRSRAGGLCFMSDIPTNPSKLTPLSSPRTSVNGAIYVLLKRRD